MQIVKGPTPAQAQRLAFELLRPVIHLLWAWGIPENVVRAESERAYRRCARTARRRVSGEQEPLAALARATTLWSQDPRFVDAAGSPRSLRLGRGAGSFAALLSLAGVSLHPPEALAHLEALGVARRCDRGCRVRLVSRLPLNSPGALPIVAPVVEAVRWFTEAAEPDAHARPSAALEPLHRRAICACVDPHRLPELRRFVRLLAETFIESVEEKLLACTLRRPSGRGARKGRRFGVCVRVYTQAGPQPVRPPGRRSSHEP